jgi:hypothetical protein
MKELEEYVYEDLLNVQDILGSEFIYEQHGENFTATQLDEDGDVVARYRVRIRLEEL